MRDSSGNDPLPNLYDLCPLKGTLKSKRKLTVVMAASRAVAMLPRLKGVGRLNILSRNYPLSAFQAFAPLSQLGLLPNHLCTSSSSKGMHTLYSSYIQ